MTRSEAQKAADKRYKETHKGAEVSWGTKLKPNEAAQIDAVVKANNLNRAEFLRWAATELEKQTKK